jgi:hypothetical protein
MTGLFRIADPAKIGPAITEIRALLGYTRIEFARAVAEVTGRDPKSVAHQLSEWHRLDNSPTMRALGPVLEALGYDLALVPREDVPDRADCGCPVFHRQALVEEHTAECSERQAAERFAASVSREMAWEGE